MTTQIVKVPASASSRAAAHELPIITAPSGNQLLVDARLLHQRLKVNHDFRNWIKNRIRDFGFEKDKDFLVNAKNLPKPTGGRPLVEYHLTLDMAKELCMVERSPIGRQFRRYFIEAEAELRTKRLYAQTASITDISKRIKPIEINGRKLYKLRPLRQLLGYSTRTSTSNIRRCNEGLLVIFNHEAYVAEEYVKVMISNSTCRALRAEAKAAKPVLQLEFNFKQKGGAHAH